MVYSQRCFSQFVFEITFCIWFLLLSFVFVCARAYLRNLICAYCFRCVFGSRLLFFFCIVWCWSAFPFRCFVVYVVSSTLLVLSLGCLFYGVCMHLYAIAVYGLYCNCYLRYCCCWRRCVVLICCLFVFVVLGGGLFSSFVRCTPPVSILYACMCVCAWPFTCMFGYVAQSLAIINSVYATSL